jgi:hypothetical protein
MWRWHHQQLLMMPLPEFEGVNNFENVSVKSRCRFEKMLMVKGLMENTYTQFHTGPHMA